MLMKRVLIAGGAGFIGSNYVRHAVRSHPDWRITVADKLTYAGNLDNLEGLLGGRRLRFVRADVADRQQVEGLFAEPFDLILNFAAETHVDRSIRDPEVFVRTDVGGAFTLLEAARRRPPELFIQVSTDEVYGSLERGAAGESSALMPSSPYAASKAGADRLAYSYFVTYALPVIITRPSNTFGPYQHPEKMIPAFITRALLGRPLPIYGDGGNIRDWLHVEDHCAALDRILEAGRPGEVYNIGARNERTNLEVTVAILAALGRSRSLIEHVPDRPGHDRRYSVDSSKLRSLGWAPRREFEQALRETIEWYSRNRSWWAQAPESSITAADVCEPAPLAQETASRASGRSARGVVDADSALGG
jgi:dTDP-glucose 4,6-dehydratase